MQEIDTILQQLNEDGDIEKIRGVTADLIVNRLRAVRDSLGYWEKAHFEFVMVVML